MAILKAIKLTLLTIPSSSPGFEEVPVHSGGATWGTSHRAAWRQKSAVHRERDVPQCKGKPSVREPSRSLAQFTSGLNEVLCRVTFNRL